MAWACMAAAGVGCTSCGGSLRPMPPASKAADSAGARPSPASKGAAASAGWAASTSKGLGARAPATCSISLRSSSWRSDVSSAVGAVLAFFISASRGSSWQRWPILRFIHRVQGRSWPSGRPVSVRRPSGTSSYSLAATTGQGEIELVCTYEIARHVLEGATISPMCIYCMYI